ncbi:cupin domain-containing protein [Vallitalea pronyensis]|uniref:Cupin domain-containing protein n=1 Tax=Vallitalea pronyensis TaxID=1348613 RepID=A0A8J8MIZ2_9FIRM|nr:cupin domain-containing protein [Vallitalea pronyensis]QUI22509.1 cupin domain-containing protein [Vallitalea pronyensis]
MIEKVYNYTKEATDLFEKIIEREDMRLNHVIIQPDKYFPKHPTDAEVCIIIIKGHLDITLANQEKMTYNSGQVVEVPKGIPSILGNGSQEPVELFVIKR